jgi:hypothetical protein
MNMSRKLVSVIGAVAMLVGACASDDDGFGEDTAAGGTVAESDSEEFSAELADAIGAGGGGVLVFDGEEIPIASAICQLAEDTFDVGTVSDNDFRVFVSRSNPLNDIGVQVLDADSQQWFPQGVSGDEAQRDGGIFTGDPTAYFNNSDDRIVQVSFTIECP